MTGEPPLGLTVLVGYDGSEAARRALRRAAELAADGGSVVIATVAEAVLPDARMGHVIAPADAEERERLLMEARTALVREGIAASTLAKDGEPATALLEAADAVRATVLVVGTRGRGRLARTLLGSVSSRVVYEASCDVLIVR